jgi:hypothetical protein
LIKEYEEYFEYVICKSLVHEVDLVEECKKLFNFTTSVIERKLYEKSILTYIYDHYLFNDHKRIMEQDKWEINIRTLKDFNWNFYDKNIKNLSKKMPHGVTGNNTVDCYVTDESNRMYYLQNMMVICHELSHMILKIYYPDSKGTLEKDDTYGKAGSVRNFFSTEIHNRVIIIIT